MRDTTGRPCALYRHWRDSELLYVGISSDPVIRLKQHRLSTSWAATITDTTTEWFADRNEAARAERRAIQGEGPTHNKSFNVAWVPPPRQRDTSDPASWELGELGRQLREARVDRYPRGQAMANALGMPQPTLSRTENGRRLPTEDEVRTWAELAGVEPEFLLELRRQAVTGDGDLLLLARHCKEGVPTPPERVAELETASTTLFEFQPRMVPGPLQHPDYTRAWLTQPGRVSWVDADGAEEIVKKRAERQHRLAEAGVAITVCVEPAVLTAEYGRPEALQEQLAMLADATREKRARVLVLRKAAPILHGFELLDDALLIESEFGLRVHSAPEQVQEWRQVRGWLEANSSGFALPS